MLLLVVRAPFHCIACPKPTLKVHALASPSQQRIRRQRLLLARLYKKRSPIEPWRRSLYVIALAELFAIMGFSISSPFLAFFIQELGVQDLKQVAFWVGLITSGSSIAMALAAPVWGMLADRYGRKPMLLRALFGGGLVLGAVGLCNSVYQVVLLRILQGTLTGTIAAATTLVATSVPREQRAFSLGLLQMAVFAGNSLGPSIGGFIGGTLGYRAAFLTTGFLLLCGGILVAAWVREQFVPAAHDKQGGNALLNTASTVARQPVLLSMLVLLMLSALGDSVTSPVLPLFVQTLVGNAREAATATGLIFGGAALANAIAAVWLGRSAGRLGRRRVLLGCLAFGSLVVSPQALARHPSQLVLLRIMAGLALGGLGPLANAIIADWAPDGKQGGIFGISASLSSVGAAVGPVLGTIVVAQWVVGAVFPAAGLVLGAMALIVALTREELDQPPAHSCGHSIQAV